MMWYWDHGSGAWWGWLLMSLGMVAFWGAVIGLVWYVITHAGAADAPAPAAPSSPDRILDERFARGEIDVDEYRARRELLHDGAGREPTRAGSRS